MPYIARINQNDQISIENEGTQSVITLIDASGQRQVRAARVESGAWRSPPALFDTGHGHLLRFHTNQGYLFFRIQNEQITPLSSPPSLSEARPIPLRPTGGQMPPRGVQTTPLSPPGAGSSQVPPPAPSGVGSSRAPQTPPPVPPAPPGSSRVLQSPQSPPPAPPGAGSSRVPQSPPSAPRGDQQASSSPSYSPSNAFQHDTPFYEYLKWWGIVTVAWIVILVLEAIFNSLDIEVGYSLSCITFMVSTAWGVQTFRTFRGAAGRLYNFLTQRIELPTTPFNPFLPSVISGVAFFMFCGGCTSLINALQTQNIKLIIGTGVDWWLSVLIFIGVVHFLSSKIILWQETNNTAHHLIPNMAAKSEEVYERMGRRIEERVPSDLLKITKFQVIEPGLRTVAEYRTVEQLEFTYGRARVAFRSKAYGRDLYVRWDSYLDFSTRRLYFILSVINMGVTHLLRFLIGPVIYDLQMAALNFINFLFFAGKESTGGRVVESGITPLDNIFFSLNWDYLPSYTIDNLQALEEAVTSSVEEVLAQLAADSVSQEDIDIDIDRSRSRYHRGF